MPNALAIFFSCCWRHSYCCCCWWPAAPPKSEPLPAANPTPSGKSPCQWRTEKLRNCCSCAAAASFSKLTRNSKTPPNFVPKMTQNGSKKLPNVFSEIQENLRESQTINPGKSQTIYSTRCLLAAAQAWIPDWGSCRAAVVVRNKTQMYYSLARSPLRLPGSADFPWPALTVVIFGCQKNSAQDGKQFRPGPVWLHGPAKWSAILSGQRVEQKVRQPWGDSWRTTSDPLFYLHIESIKSL